MSGALKSARQVGGEEKSELPSDEVVQLVSNECRTASDIVKQWLAQMSASSSTPAAAPESASSVGRAAEPPPAEPEVRPARLGLGAHYLPHSRAVKLESDLARRLQRHIAAKPRSQQDDDEPSKAAAKKAPKKKKQDEEQKAAITVTRRRPVLPLDGLLGKKTLPMKKQRRQ